MLVSCFENKNKPKPIFGRLPAEWVVLLFVKVCLAPSPDLHWVIVVLALLHLGVGQCSVCSYVTHDGHAASSLSTDGNFLKFHEMEVHHG